MLKGIKSFISRLLEKRGLGTLDRVWESLLSSSNSISGVAINRETVFQYSPIWAAVGIISRDCAKLPANVFKRKRDGSRTKDLNHSAAPLVGVRPNEFMTPYQFKQKLLWESLVIGNSYSWIRRDGLNPVELLPLDPLQTRIERGRRNEFIYVTSFESEGEDFAIDRNDMIHLKGLGDGIAGKLVYLNAKNSFGIGLSTQEYVNRFFSNNATSTMAFVHPGVLDDDAAVRLRESIQSRQSGLKNAWKPWILEEDIKIQELRSNNEESQLAELMEQSVRDVSNWFYIPAHKISDTSKTSFASLAEENAMYLSQTLDPWLVNLEEELERKLLKPTQHRKRSVQIEFDRSMLTRANHADKGDFWSKMINFGVLNRDEVRAEIGLNPYPDGEGKVFLIPANLMEPGEESEQSPSPTSTPTSTPSTPQDGSDNDSEGSNGSDDSTRNMKDLMESYRLTLRALLTTSIHRICDQAQKAAETPDTFIDWVESEMVTKNKEYLEDRLGFRMTTDLIEEISVRLIQATDVKAEKLYPKIFNLCDKLERVLPGKLADREVLNYDLREKTLHKRSP